MLNCLLTCFVIVTVQEPRCSDC